MEVKPNWSEGPTGISLVALYLAFTVVGLLVSMGLVASSFIDRASTSEFIVPAYIYLYSFLGALAYVFTSLTNEFEKTPEG